MIKETVETEVYKPEVEDHESYYDKFLCNTHKKDYLFSLLTEPESIVKALIIAENTGSSPMVAYEKMISSEILSGKIEKLDPHEKQFVGTVICTIMKANGWKKTDRKQRFSSGIFKSAEIYEPV